MDLLFPEIVAYQSTVSDKEQIPAQDSGRHGSPSQSQQINNSLAERPLPLRDHLHQRIVGAAQTTQQQLDSFNRHESRRSFRDVVSATDRSSQPVRFRPITIAGNIAVRIDGEKYRRGLAKFENCLIGRLVLFKGNLPMNSDALKKKLSSLWLLPEISWKMISLGKGFFCLDLKNPAAKSKVFARGTLSINPGMFYISKWIPNFNPSTQKITNTQVWIKIHNLSMDYWKEEFLLDIGMGIGTSLRVDRITLEQEMGHFARVLVDIDVSKDLPERILVQIDDFEFFVEIEYENLPDFCKLCNGIGHDLRDCRLNKARSESTPPAASRAAGRTAQPPATNVPLANDTADDCAAQSPVPPTVDSGADIGMVLEQSGGIGSKEKRSEDCPVQDTETLAENVNGTEALSRADDSCSGYKTHVSDSYIPPESDSVFLGANNSPATNNATPSGPPVAEGIFSQSPNALMMLPFHCEELLEDNNATKTTTPYHPYKQISSSVSSSSSPSHSTKCWGDWEGDEHASLSSGNSHRFQLKAGVCEVEAQLYNMNIGVIYWIPDRDIYIHASGMCFDPKTKVYFKRIDPINGDLRSIHYLKRSGDFTPAQNGKSGNHNKIIFADTSWDRSAIYSVKTPNYRPGLPKLFTEKVIDF